MKFSTQHRIFKWLMLFGIWTLAGFFFTSQFVLQNQLSPRPVPVYQVLSWQLFSGYVWFALMPVIFLLAGRFSFERGRFWMSLVVHLTASLVLSAIQLAVIALVLPQLGYPPNRQFASFGEAYRFFLIVNLHLSITIYWAVLGIKYAVNYYRMYQERELRAAQLENQLAQTRLLVLKNQLHPHFLFNTLNNISELVYKDPEAAEQMIASLSDLLRIALDKLDVQEVSLQQELEFLGKYLEIEQMRFNDRLQVKFEIASDALDARVPNMILQPLVENAIKYGISPRAEGGCIEIGANRANGHLNLKVADDGLGVPFGDVTNLNEGVGLSNTRARLKHLYGAEHNFVLQTRESGGLQLDLQIPFRSNQEK
ncbi:MAG: histidine kinase [Acidobacteriota bacterium]|nr:histidine kinase [Acidobacteriota bacterium]